MYGIITGFLVYFMASFALAAPGQACINSKRAIFPQYTPVRLTGKSQGQRLEVQNMKGATAFVARRELSFGMRCVTVKVERSRLRKGPGKDFKPAQLSERGESFIDLGGEDGWTQVQNQKGEKAWINLDHTWTPTSRKMRLSFDPDN